MKFLRLITHPLNMPAVSRVRRNHALEHATMHVLSERRGNQVLVGRSSIWGFRVYGRVPMEDVAAAAQEGLRRLTAGRREMAVHPNCGSNIALAGSLAAVGAFLALGGGREKKGWRLMRLPAAMMAATLGVLLAQPLGPVFQATVTTQPDVGKLRITGVSREVRAGVVIHSVRTEV